MVLRIVSGVLRTNVDSGFVTIELKSNSIVGGIGNAIIEDSCEYGGNTHYDVKPCSTLSIRALSGSPTWANINGPSFDGPTTHYENATIRWWSFGGQIIEISYFFAGEE